MKKKIIFCTLVLGVFLGVVIFFFPPLAGVYRSELAEILAEGYQGYVYLNNGKAYAVNLNNLDSNDDVADYLGTYKRLDNGEFVIKLYDNREFKLKYSLLGISWLNSEFDDDVAFFEGLRVWWVPTIIRVESAVTKVRSQKKEKAP